MIRRCWRLMTATTLVVVILATTACSGGNASRADDGDTTKQLIAGHIVPDGATGAQLPVTIEGDDGVSVTVSDISRIVTLRASISEVIYYLGLGDNVVGRDESTTFDEASDVPIVTNGHEIGAEALLALEPTVVLVDTDTGPPEVIDQLRSVGLPVVVFDPVVRIEDIRAHMIAVSDAVGLHDRGVELADETESRLATVTAQHDTTADRPRVAFLYLRGNAGVYLLGGPGSGADAMIAAAGGLDVGTDMGLEHGFTPLTNEALVKAAPDIILVTTTGLESVGGLDGLLAMPGVAQTPAGAAGNVVPIEDGVLYSFGVRTPETIDAIGQRFTDLITGAKG